LLVTQDTDLSLRTIKRCSVVFGVTLRLLVINISSTSPAINKLRRLLPAMSQLATIRWRRVDNTWSVAALTARDGLGSESRFLPTPPACITPVGGGGFPSDYCHNGWHGKKPRTVWLPDSEKIRFYRIDERDKHTDTRTDTA